MRCAGHRLFFLLAVGVRPERFLVRFSLGGPAISMPLLLLLMNKGGAGAPPRSGPGVLGLAGGVLPWCAPGWWIGFVQTVTTRSLTRGAAPGARPPRPRNPFYSFDTRHNSFGILSPASQWRIIGPLSSTVGDKPLLSQSRYDQARSPGGCLIAKSVPHGSPATRPPTILFFHVSIAAVSLPNSSRTRHQRSPTKRASRSLAKPSAEDSSCPCRRVPLQRVSGDIAELLHERHPSARQRSV
jgi:hypothetical protein